ncbi:MAG: endolytic transglycosylase MltG [Candidatus Moranbacteria bacterium]|nr:endolytic transglycosylase MltG [Candidatus Moranbacteria bacterium]
MKRTVKFSIGIGTVAVLFAGAWFAYATLFSSPQSEGNEEIFIVNRNQTAQATAKKLKSQGFIRNGFAFSSLLFIRGKRDAIAPGGYHLSKNMNVWRIAKRLIADPDLKWVTIPEGWRKEQIGELLAKMFGWSDEELDTWDTVYTKMRSDYIEGTYFPDTYLIPITEKGLDIADRMTRRFDQRFAPYVGGFAAQNIKWTTGLKLASIIQREAGGKDDMPIISGALWNRLDKGMNLEIDATVQYARGKTDSGWWAPVTSDDIRNIDSPYNTYKYRGLPPTPISNPGLAAIDAALHPAETDCLYYLHDADRQIHCATTYEEHVANIETFLK